MKEIMCQIVSLILGFFYMGKSIIYWGEENAQLYTAVSLLFVFVSILFSNIQDKEDKK